MTTLCPSRRSLTVYLTASTELLHKKLANRRLPLHVTLCSVDLETDVALTSAPVGGPGPTTSEGADLEMGEVGTAEDPQLASPPRLLGGHDRFAISDEVFPRPLQAGLHPLSVSHVLRAGSSSNLQAADSLQVAILDIAATPSSTYSSTLYQHRHDILRSFAHLAYLAMARGGERHTLPDHIAAVHNVSHDPSHLCKL